MKRFDDDGRAPLTRRDTFIGQQIRVRISLLLCALFVVGCPTSSSTTDSEERIWADGNPSDDEADNSHDSDVVDDDAETLGDDSADDIDESEDSHTIDEDGDIPGDASQDSDAIDDDASADEFDTLSDESQDSDTAEDDENTVGDGSQDVDTIEDDADMSGDESQDSETPDEDGPCPAYLGLNTVGAVFVYEYVDGFSYTGTQTTTVEAHVDDADGVRVHTTTEIDAGTQGYTSYMTNIYRCDDEGAWSEQMVFSWTHGENSNSGIRDYENYLVGKWNPTLGMTWSSDVTMYLTDKPEADPSNFTVTYEVLSTSGSKTVGAGSFDDPLTLSYHDGYSTFSYVYAAGFGLLAAEGIMELLSAEIP